MDRNRLLGWVLLTLVFLLWLQYNAKKNLEKSQNQHSADSSSSLGHKEKGDSISFYSQGSEDSGSLARFSSKSAPGELEISGTEDSLANATEFFPEPERTYKVESNRLIVVVSNKGACVSSIRIKDEAISKNADGAEIIPEEAGCILMMEINGENLSEIVWTPMEDYPDHVNLDRSRRKLRFTTRLQNGQTISRVYTFFPDSSVFHHSLFGSAGDWSGRLFWPAGMRETEERSIGKGFGGNYGYFSEIVLHYGVSSVSRERFKGTKVFNEKSGVLRWVGLRRKYTAALLDFNRDTQYQVSASVAEPKGGSDELPSYSMAIRSSDDDSKLFDFDFVVLPLRYNHVLAMGRDYEKIIFSGYEWFFRADVWYVKLCGLVLNILKLFYAVLPNYGIAIILLTILVRVILLPLTVVQTRSMSKMQEHAPAIREIKEKFKGNPQKANKEVMAYYRKAGVNPMSGMMGCLPMLMQFPVFIALFNVLGRVLELKEAPFFLWISDLSRPDVLIEAVKVPFVFPQGITVLPLAMAVTMFFQTKATVTDPNQKAMIYIMPVMLFFFSASFPSGLVLYWTVSNIFTIVQTRLIVKSKVISKSPSGKLKSNHAPTAK